MADKPNKTGRLKASLPRGLLDRGAAEIAGTRRMLDCVREVYERYGFEPVETPAIEYADALGKFLPDQDRPHAGVFSFQDDDEQWLSLRYDLTAPLARFVAENFEHLPKPFRSYRVGWVSFAGRKSGAAEYFAALELLSSLRLCSNVPAQWAVQTALGGYQSIKDLVTPGGRLFESRRAIANAVSTSRFLDVQRSEGRITGIPRPRSAQGQPVGPVGRDLGFGQPVA